MKRTQVQDAKPTPGRQARALKAGPHGRIKNSDGSKNSEPSKHDGKKNLAKIG